MEKKLKKAQGTSKTKAKLKEKNEIISKLKHDLKQANRTKEDQQMYIDELQRQQRGNKITGNQNNNPNNDLQAKEIQNLR